MKATVFHKGQGWDPQAVEANQIVLSEPSVVELPLGPEQIDQYLREGDHLKLILQDGTVVIIENFFVQTSDGRNDLVLVDENDVIWWAQYGETWNGFDITEIDADIVAAGAFPTQAVWAWAGLGLLAGGVALAVADSGSSSAPSSGLPPDPPSPNTPPVGAAEPIITPEDTPIDGVVTGTDVDGDPLTFKLTDGGDPEHGSVTVNPDGSYQYIPDEGYHGPDSFDVTVDDGQGGADTVTVIVTVTPVDPAVITGNTEGATIEAGGTDNATPGSPSASGKLTVTNAEEGEAGFQQPTSLNGIYGEFSFDPASGEWSYILDDTREATQALVEGETVTDQLVITSLDGTATETITVTLTGANDIAKVTDDSGQVKEDNDGGTGTLTTNGQVTVEDVDAGENRFDVDSLAFVGRTTALGKLVIEEDGSWTYSVDNSLSKVQSLALGEKITEVWTVDSVDGTATSTITITINGTNDTPRVSGAASGAVAEDGVSTATGQLTVRDVDTSNTHTWRVTGSSGKYGELSVDSTGTWTYVLDNTHPDVQALAEGRELIDKITVRVTDNDGGYDQQVVTITITGSNNEATITGDTTGAVVEAGGVENDELGTPSASGTLIVEDIDSGEAVFQAPAPTDLEGTYGTFIFDQNTGEWTYTLDNDRAVTQSLIEGEEVTEELVVTSFDGTAIETILVTITGTNDVPLVTDGTGGVTEDVAVDSNGLLNTSGQITITDPDAGQSTFNTGSLAFDSASHSGAARGTLTINSEGEWVYQIDNTLPEVQSLALGESFTESWSVDSADGTATSIITVTINGTNDTPEVSGSASGDVIEDDQLTTTGQLTVSDIDISNTHEWTVDKSTGEYGQWSVDDSGEWTYTLDNSSPEVQALPEGETLFDEVVVRVTDNDGGYAEQKVIVTITGTNNDATITGEATGAVTEAGGVNNNEDGNPDASGTLTVHDIDSGEAVFQAPAPTALEGTYGTFTFDESTGEWTYILGNDRAATEALTEGEKVTDELTVTSLDSTATETITVDITGANDVPLVTSGAGEVTEDTDVDTDGMLSVNGQIEITDIDAGESEFDVGTLVFDSASHGGTTPLGTVTIDSAGNWTYEVDNSLTEVQSLAQGETITEIWTVKSADGAATSTIIVTINGVNDAPVQQASVPPQSNEDAEPDISLDVSGYFNDPDTSDTLTYTATGLPNGLTLNPDSGLITGTIDNSASQDGDDGEHEVTITADDGKGGTVEQVFTWTITNPAPTANPDKGSITEDGPDLVVTAENGVITSASDPEGADSDPDGDNLEVTHVTTGTVADESDFDTAETAGTPVTSSYGALTLNADGSYTYELDNDNPIVNALNEGEELTDTFSYAISDGEGGTAFTTLTITIQGNNDGEPTIVASDENDSEDGQLTVYEAGLTSDGPSGQAAGASGIITISAGNDIENVTIAGTTLTLLQLEALTSASSVNIDTPQGTLTLTGYSSTSDVGGISTAGDLSYTYTLDTTVTNPDAASSNHIIAVCEAGSCARG